MEAEDKKFEYDIKDTDHSFRVGLGHFSLAEIYYKHPRCETPVTKEKAEELANSLKAMIETQYPIEALNAEDYEPSESFKMFEEMMEDDDCPTLLKMMALSSMMSD